MSRKIDLHVHTNASDGTYSPEEIIDYAMGNGISAMAVCDHDTVDGIQAAADYAKVKGFDLIAGVEFSLEWAAGSFHLLGLFIDHNDPDIVSVTARLKKSRTARIIKMVEALNKEGYEIDLREVEREAGNSAAGKPHIARVMIRKGYAKEMKEIFTNFMCLGKPGYVERDRISLQEALSVIKNAGGIAIVAHPVSLNLKTYDKYNDKLVEFRECGVEGIEAYSSMHTMNDVSGFLNMADKNGMLVSGGSDFHGDPVKQIGVYTDGNFIPAEVLDRLREYIRR